MAKYKFTDFKKGDKVYHLSNSRLFMVIIDMPSENEIICRWLNDKGELQKEGFMAEELGKADDLKPKIGYRTI